MGEESWIVQSPLQRRIVHIVARCGSRDERWLLKLLIIVSAGLGSQLVRQCNPEALCHGLDLQAGRLSPYSLFSESQPNMPMPLCNNVLSDCTVDDVHLVLTV